MQRACSNRVPSVLEGRWVFFSCKKRLPLDSPLLRRDRQYFCHADGVFDGIAIIRGAFSCDCEAVLRLEGDRAGIRITRFEENAGDARLLKLVAGCAE